MSIRLTPFRIETGLWLMAIIALGIGIKTEIDWGQGWKLPDPQTQTATDELKITELALPYELSALDTFMETTLRPMFVATRRPAPIPPPPEPPKPQMRKGQFSLTGTTIVAEGKFAHLVEKVTNKAFVLAEGKEVNGLKVRQVTPDFVILTQFEDSETVVLSTAKAPLLSPGTQR
jgi:hypothetical protein